MTPDHPHEQTLADYIAVVRRHKWIVLLVAILVPVAAYVTSARQDKLFSASAEIFLNRQDLGSALTGVPSASSFSDAERYARTQAALARVPKVARRAIKNAGIDGMYAYELLDASSVTPRDNADLLRFNVLNEDPDRAVSLATSYAKAFTEYKLEMDTANLARARKELEARLAELRSQGASNTNVYRDLLEKAQDLRTVELLQSGASVVRPSTAAGQIEPTPTRNAMLGAILGVLLGLGIAFLWNALDKRIRSAEEVERALGMPLLARMPKLRRKVRGDEKLVMLDDPADKDAEAVRRLRTNLELANIDLGAKVIMITSAVAEEGKSTTVANLAIALARSGRNVALVDLDLRQPAIAGFFALKGRPGVTDVALGRVDLDVALAPMRLPIASRSGDNGALPATAMGRLHVLPTGQLPSNPGEFVGTQALMRVLEELRRGHDYVLVDSPPMLAVGDPITLSTRVDAIVPVVRLGVANRPMLRDLARNLRVSPAPKLGFVFTGAEAHEMYGYTYGYYGSDQAEESSSGLREVSSIGR